MQTRRLRCLVLNPKRMLLRVPPSGPQVFNTQNPVGRVIVPEDGTQEKRSGALLFSLSPGSCLKRCGGTACQGSAAVVNPPGLACQALVGSQSCGRLKLG